MAKGRDLMFQKRMNSKFIFTDFVLNIRQTYLDGNLLPHVVLGTGGPGQEGAHVLRNLIT